MKKLEDIISFGNNKLYIDSLRKEYTNSRITPFIGAGVSMDLGFPSWKQLLLDIADEVYGSNTNDKKNFFQLINEGKYQTAADNVLSKDEYSIKEKICDIIKGYNNKINIDNLETSLAFTIHNIFKKRPIITTNYDMILEKVCGDDNYYRYTPFNCKEAKNCISEATKTVILKIHGDIISNQNEIVLSKKDYDNIYQNKSDVYSLLSYLHKNSDFLFIGSSLDFDAPEPDRFLNFLTTTSNIDPDKYHYAILPYNFDINDDSEKSNKKIQCFINNMLSHNIKAIIFPDTQFDYIQIILQSFSCLGIDDPVIEGKEKSVERPEKRITTDKKHAETAYTVEKEIFGYCISYGMSSCRIFSMRDTGLDEEEYFKYSLELEEDRSNITEYTKEIITFTKSKLIPWIKNKGVPFIKVFADVGFNRLWNDDKKEQDEFVNEFYQETHLFFNILTNEQMLGNIKNKFGESASNTAFIDIGTRYIDIWCFDKNNKSKNYSLDISSHTVQEFIFEKGISADGWTDDDQRKIKDYLKNKFKEYFIGVEIEKAFILKDELNFMQGMGYDLKSDGSTKSISKANYIKNNQKLLYKEGYKERINRNFPGVAEARINSFLSFKHGHIVLETLCDVLKVKTIIPSNHHNIHVSINAYIFNVVLTGSTKPNRLQYMKEAYEMFEKLGINVLSPLKSSTDDKNCETYRKQAVSIRECDLLFVCNKDGYLGSQTKRDIYGAFLLSKPIAFWNEPTITKECDEKYFLDCIPHEVWKLYMDKILKRKMEK